MIGLALGLAKALGPSLFGVFRGRQANQQTQLQTQQLEVSNKWDVEKELRASYTAEMSQVPRNWFDSLVNGINRLMRPFIVFGTIFMTYKLLDLALADPESFDRAMEAFGKLPPVLAGTIAAVPTFYLGAQTFSKVAEHRREHLAKLDGKTPTTTKKTKEVKRAGKSDEQIISQGWTNNR